LSKRIWMGGLFLVIGFGILLHQMELWDFGYIFKQWWPLIIIVIGIEQLFNRHHSSPIFSFMLILIGALFLANQWLDLNLVAFIWPIILIFIGLTIIFTHRKHHKVIDSNQSIKAFSLFSGTNLRSQAESIQGGDITAVFGGAEIDLRDATISEKGATFDLTSIFGGIELTVPENVRVEVTGLPIFGGWEDKTRRAIDEDDALLIKIHCLTIFGGVEIKD